MRQKSHTVVNRSPKIEVYSNSGLEYIMMKDRVEDALKDIRPLLQADGGDVELLSVEDGIVKVRLTGACGNCPMAALTLQNSVKKVLKEKVPDIKELVAV